MARFHSLPARASANCPSCGLANADLGEGVCAQCGNRLGGTMLPPPVPLGTRVSGFEVTGSRAEDLLARSAEGELVMLASGSAALLAVEAGALRALVQYAPVPRPLALGTDPTYGHFLALTHDGSLRPLVEARTLRVGGVVALARQLVDLAEAIARAGVAWQPLPHDFHLTDRGTLALSRCRVRSLAPSAEGVDVRAAFEAAGGALLPLPGALGPTRLVRLLSARGPGGAGAALSPAEARAEIALVERELETPPRETAPGITALSDQGFCRDSNQDATAVATGELRGERWSLLVVCDGVSASSSAEQASALAATTTRDALAHFARSGDLLHEGTAAAMEGAIRAAHLALCATPIVRDGAEPPGTTLVAALVFRKRAVVGWAGDSRAYWITRSGAELLTRDHSWAVERVTSGELSEAQAMAAPLAHALTKCLGPLELAGEQIEEIAPDVVVRDLRGRGHLVVCTDGLWNYFPGAAELAAVVRAAGEKASTALIARCLVNHALARGGGDNVSVAVLAHEA